MTCAFSKISYCSPATSCRTNGDTWIHQWRCRSCQDLSDWEKQGFFFAEIRDKTYENNGNESDKENEEEKEETEEEINLTKALEMADKLKTYCLRKVIADVHSQVSEIEDKIMNFSSQNLKQSSIISYFNKPVSSSQ